MPAARELLVALHRAGFLLAIGSSAPPENVDLALDRMEAESLFEAVVTGQDIRRGKPDPQVFLTAAARLRVPPEWCAVVEDAPAGIAAALAAEMTAIGLASTGRTRAELAAAHLVVDSLRELSPAVIEDLIVRRLQ
jgi:beta-phosphoglucomutase